jgi:hypothetical protein
MRRKTRRTANIRKRANIEIKAFRIIMADPSGFFTSGFLNDGTPLLAGRFKKFYTLFFLSSMVLFNK